MRTLYLSDLHAASCALRRLPDKERAAAIAAAISDAKTADRYRKRLHKAHPAFGTGTLASVFGPVVEPHHCDAAYLAALAVVLEALRDC